MRYLCFILAVLLTSGCFTQSRQEDSTRTLDRVQYTTPDGRVATKEVEQTTSTGTTKVEPPIDVAALFSAGMSALKGDLVGSIGSVAKSLEESNRSSAQRMAEYEKRVMELTGRLDAVNSTMGNVALRVGDVSSSAKTAQELYEQKIEELKSQLVSKGAELAVVSSKSGFSSPEAQTAGGMALVTLLTTVMSTLNARKKAKEAEANEEEREKAATAARIAAEHADRLEKLASQVATMTPEEAKRILDTEISNHKKLTQAKQEAAGVVEVTRKIRGKA